MILRLYEEIRDAIILRLYEEIRDAIILRLYEENKNKNNIINRGECR